MAKVLLRALCLVAVVAVGGAVVSHRASAQMQVNPTSPYVQITLLQQLEQGLKCRQPGEFAWVRYVVRQVDKNKLPLSLVNICFDWSRKRSNHIPFVYFKQSLIMLAAQQGITLKDFGGW
ncbi:MAG TPA: hypothetical protein VHD36_14925 [Pirellulales bacterium]|nr:hypothetical protein [Pirellulales bacterium]